MIELKFIGEDTQDILRQIEDFVKSSQKKAEKVQKDPPVDTVPLPTQPATMAETPPQKPSSVPTATAPIYSIDEIRLALAKLAQDKGPEMVQQSLSTRFGTHIISELDDVQLAQLSQLLRGLGVL